MKRQLINTLILILLMCSIGFAVPADPGIVSSVDGCRHTAISGNVPLFSVYTASCQINKAAPAGILVGHEYAVDIDRTSDNGLIKHYAQIKPECSSMYEGGDIEDGCFLISTINGEAIIEFVITSDLFTVNTEYETLFHADNISSTTLSFNVTAPTLTIDRSFLSPNYAEEFMYVARTNNQFGEYFCDAYLFDGVDKERNIGRFTTTDSKPFEIKDNSFGLRLYKNYSLILECSNYATDNQTVRVGVSDPIDDTVKAVSPFLAFLGQIAVALVIFLVLVGAMWLSRK